MKYLLSPIVRSFSQHTEIKLNQKKTIVTDIYETELFYQFTDNKTFYFSVPKVSLLDKSVIEDYKHDSDLPDTKMTAVQAMKQVILTDMLFNAYISYAYQNKLGNPLNGHGVIIPKEFSKPTQNKATIGVHTVCDGAATILGNLYYKVSFYQDQTSLGNSYYINAEKENSIFSISMVSGELIPVSSTYAHHYHSKNSD